MRDMPFANILCLFVASLNKPRIDPGLLIHTKGILDSLLTFLTSEPLSTNTDWKVFDCLVNVINLVRRKDPDVEEGKLHLDLAREL